MNSRHHMSINRTGRTLPLRQWPTCLLAGLAAVALFESAPAQYAIHSFTVDAGGDTSSGGPYSLRGTIGQADAGPRLKSVSHGLLGGFWSVLAIQTPGAPELRIIPAGPGMVTIWWTPDSPEWVLQQRGGMEPLSLWTVAPSGATNPITIPVTKDKMFFRLAEP